MDIQVKVLPTPSSIEDGNIYQYIGPTNDTYTNGFFYTCRNRNSSWGWYLINVQDWIEEKAKSIITNYGQLYLKNFETTPESSWTSLFRDVEKQWVAGHRNIFLIWDKVDKTYELCRVITYNVASDTMALVDHNHTIYSVTRSHHLVKEAQSLRISVMPEASEKELGNVYEFTGESDLFDTEYRYICRFKNGVYYWEKLDQYSPIPPTPSGDRYVSIDPNQGLTSTEKMNAKKNIDLDKVGNFKAVSTVANQSLTQTEITNAWKNIKLDQLSSDKVIAMTGYEKPEETDAITEEDTLNEAIGKLEKALESIQPEHTHTSADIISMSGYLKGDDYSGIMTTDNLNQAIGKLENQIDRKSTVSISGTMVSGNTIGTITIDGNPTDIKVKNSVTSVTESSTDSNSGRIHITYADGTTEDIKVHNINNAAFRDVDDEITEDSEKLITSGAVYDALDGAELTDENVTQTPTVDATDTGDFEVLLAGDTSDTEYTGHTKKSNWLKFSPSTKKLLINSKEVSTEGHAHVSPDVTIDDYDKTGHTGDIADDDTLNEALAKLENALDDKAALSHTHAQSDIMMTGYNRGTDSSAVTGSDTLGEAIGKLENRIISGQGSVVSITGTLTSGSKIGTITIDGTSTDLNVPESVDEKVKQTIVTNSNAYTLLMSESSASTTEKTEGAGKSTKLTFVPSTSELRLKNGDDGYNVRLYGASGGTAYVEIGNSQTSAGSGNTRGALQIYDQSKYYVRMMTKSLTDYQYIDLPNDSGTIALTKNIIDENVTQTPTSSSDTSDIEVILAGNNNNSTYIGGVKKSDYLKFNPSTKKLFVNGNEVSVNGHTHVSPNVTIDDYDSTEVSGDITDGDDLNTALAKLENAVNSKASSTHVHSGGDITTGVISQSVLPSATTSVSGIVQLSSSTGSTSEDMAATPKAVKIAYELAANHTQSSDTVNIDDDYEKPESYSEIEPEDTLTEAIGKLEAAIDEVAPLSHNHSSDDITSMGSYSKLSDSTPVTGSDTLNQAISKLENQIDDKSTVSITGTLTSGSDIGTITIDGVPTTLKAPSGGAGTDENVTQTDTTTNSTYNVLFSYSTNSTTTKTEGARKSSRLTFNPATSKLTILSSQNSQLCSLEKLSDGGAYISLGNALSGTSGDSYGLIKLYSTGSQRVDLLTSTLTDDRTLYLPNKNGTLAITTDIPSISPVLTEGTKIATVTLGSATTNLYAPSGGSGGTDENVKQTATTESGSYEILFSYTADNNTRTEGVRKSNQLTFNPGSGHFRIYNTNHQSAFTFQSDTPASQGEVWAWLTLGNGLSSYGVMDLYGANGRSARLKSSTLTATRTLYLPDKDGTLAITDDIPSISPVLTSGIKIATVTLGSTTTDVYCRDENVAQTATTTNANYEVLFSYSANDNTNHIEGVRKSSNLKFNPSTGTLTAYNFEVANAQGYGPSVFTTQTYESPRVGTMISWVIDGLTPETSGNTFDYPLIARYNKPTDDQSFIVINPKSVEYTPNVTADGNRGWGGNYGLVVGYDSLKFNGTTVKITDENVTQTPTTETEPGSYELLFSYTADNNTRTEGVRKSDLLTFSPNTTQPTLLLHNKQKQIAFLLSSIPISTNDSKSLISLGNYKSSGSVGNSYGVLQLYGTGAYRVNLLASTLTEDHDIYLPDEDGTLAITDDIPSITQVLTSGTKIATVTLGSTTTNLYAPSGGTSTDENVKQTPTTESGSYEILFSYTAGNTDRTEGARKSDRLTFNPSSSTLYICNSQSLAAFSFKCTSGTSTSNGASYITLGNVLSSSAGNSYGYLRMYGTGMYYADLLPSTLTDYRTLYLPNKAGTLAITDDIPTITQVLTSGTKIATVTLGSTTTDLYAPAGGTSTDENVKQTNTTTDSSYNVLFSYSTNTTTAKTEGTRKSSNLTFNPSTGVLTATGVNAPVHINQQDGVNHVDRISAWRIENRTPSSGKSIDYPSIARYNRISGDDYSYIAIWPNPVEYPTDDPYNEVYRGWGGKFGLVIKATELDFNGVKLYDSSTGLIPNARLTSATTDTAGIVKLSSSTTSSSTTLAATPSAVKSAYDLANGKSTVSFTQSLTSGTQIGTITINNTPTVLYCQDKNVTQTATTANESYELLFSYTADNTTRTEGVRKASSLLFNPSSTTLFMRNSQGNLAGRIVCASGTTTSEGKSILIAGNDVASGTVGNSYGTLQLYSTGIYYAELSPSTLTAKRTLYLPDKGGTLAITSQIYDATTSRTANTVLAAPNGSAGAASFRTLVAADLPTSGVTAGSYGPSANASPGHGGSFNVPYITFDNKGRATSASTKTITLPSQFYNVKFSTNRVIISNGTTAIASGVTLAKYTSVIFYVSQYSASTSAGAYCTTIEVPLNLGVNAASSVTTFVGEGFIATTSLFKVVLTVTITSTTTLSVSGKLYKFNGTTFSTTAESGASGESGVLYSWAAWGVYNPNY